MQQDIRQRHAWESNAAKTQRTLRDEFGHSYEYTQKPSEKIPRAHIILLVLLFYFSGIYGIVNYFYTWLPDPVPLDAPASVFSEARARQTLDKIMSFGYRPVGTVANEVLIPAYLIKEIEMLQSQASDDVLVEIDIQKPSGGYALEFLTPFQNVYANVTNLLVRVAPRSSSEIKQNEYFNQSLLLSAHYDAAIGGAAASDDGVGIAILMELLRLNIAKPPKYGSLIFNFNGAEETLLQASHGFITQHKWASHIRAFINIEAAGAGGRELLFQTGSDELAMAYAEAAPYPHASIVAQEVFQSGIIPADTDFRVYRDYGQLAGMDFAYISNGYVYHTMLDDVSRIQQGSIQRLGDNLDGVIDKLVRDEHRPDRLTAVANTPVAPHTLFFDVMGFTMFTMSKYIAQIMWSLVTIGVLAYFSWWSPFTWKERLANVRFLGECFVSGLIPSLCIAVILSLFSPLSWYSSPVLAVFLLGILPFNTGLFHQLAKIVHRIGRKKIKNEQNIEASIEQKFFNLEEGLFEAAACYWLLGLLAFLALQLISAYLFAIWLIFPLIGHAFSRFLLKKGFLQRTGYFLVSLVALTPPLIHSALLVAIALIFFIPLMGRSGTLLPPDLVMAAVFWALQAILYSYAIRYICLVPLRQMYIIRNVLFGLTICLLLFASIRNPYSNDCPKRLYIFHVVRDVDTGSIASPSGLSDSGLWINPLDFRRSADLLPILKHTRTWESIIDSVSAPSIIAPTEIYGWMPFALPMRFALPEIHSLYLPANKPSFLDSKDAHVAQLEVLSSHFSPDTNRRRLDLHLTGPSHINIYIDSKKIKLTAWSIGPGDRHEPICQDGESYFLQFISATQPAEFYFWIESESDSKIEIVLVGHYLNQVRTPELQELISGMPSWISVSEGISTWRWMKI